MKVLLIKDVYKLGHAGDVKKVADGYGRNFLLPQGLAVLATPGALTTVEKIRAKAAVSRAAIEPGNGRFGWIGGRCRTCPSPAKPAKLANLYGSITTQMIADALNEKLGTKIERHQVEVEPIRMLGEHHATIRLTIDLNPKVKVFVTREGEVAVKPVKASAKEEVKIEEAVVEEVVAETVTETVDETQAEEPKAE